MSHGFTKGFEVVSAKYIDLIFCLTLRTFTRQYDSDPGLFTIYLPLGIYPWGGRGGIKTLMTLAEMSILCRGI